MRPSLLLFLLVCVLVGAPAVVEVFSWVDGRGVTHFGDDPSQVPAGAERGRGEIDTLWDDGVLALRGAAVMSPGRPRLADERIERLLRGAVADLERGENARARVALESVLRRQPAQPDAHWYLALLARQRGRYARAELHLQKFLASAGEAYEPQRAAARQKLAELADERRLADAARLAGRDEWVGVTHPNFRVYYDAVLDDASPDYATRVVDYLEAAHAEVGERLGSIPEEPLGVMLYGKAAYLRAHRHRFSFQTVGFFDGRIHVVSAAHPAGELRALLFHEYAHAVFRERSGGDRPYWLNEGMAELAERASRKLPGLSRDERSSLRRRIDAGEWIPLRRLAPSFAGLTDEDARAAYVQSTAAAEWIVARTTREGRGRVLAALDEGVGDDVALERVLGMDTAAIDAAVMGWVRSEFAPARLEP